MQRPFVFGIVILGLSCAAWWGARNPVAGTEPPVNRAVLKQAPKSEIPINAQVLVKTRILEADQNAVNDAWTQLAKKADTEHKAEAAKSTFHQAAAFSESLVATVVAELSKHPRTSVKCEPSIKVGSGRVACFISGGEFAVPQIIGVGGSSGTTTTLRICFGTSLEVKPTVLKDGQIRLALTLDESSINESNSVAGVPGLNVRRANTTQLVNPGQTIVMVLPTQPLGTPAGTEAKSGEKRTEPPPSKKVDDSAQRSLFVIVTAEIAKPMEADQAGPTVLPASVEDVAVLTPYTAIPWRSDLKPSDFPSVVPPSYLPPVAPWPSALQIPNTVTPSPRAWPYAGPGYLAPTPPQPIELSRLQHLQSAKHHLEQAGLTDEVAAVQKAIKLEQQSATRRDVQRRERELEQMQKELDSLRRSLSEESESSQSP